MGILRLRQKMFLKQRMIEEYIKLPYENGIEKNTGKIYFLQSTRWSKTNGRKAD